MTKSTTPARAARLKMDRVEVTILGLGMLSLLTLFTAAMALVAM